MLEPHNVSVRTGYNHVLLYAITPQQLPRPRCEGCQERPAPVSTGWTAACRFRSKWTIQNQDASKRA